MTIYNIHHTKSSVPTINVDETDIDVSTDLKFFGRRRLQYGQDMNQNILFLLENFACPEDSDNIGNPDLTVAVNITDNTDGDTYQTDPLVNPIDGQLWYNSTQQCLFFWDSDTEKWYPIGMQDDIAANWGILYNGGQMPQPVSSRTGQQFAYSECSWIVSPYQFPQQLQYMVCESDENAFLTSIYQINGDSTIYSGFATYLIVGIRGNENLGTIIPIPSPTPTVSFTNTPGLSGTPAPTPAVTPTPTTPSPSSTYSGNLTAFFNAKTPNVGTVKPYFNGDSYRLPYPGITTTKYKILYTTTTPAAPYNPWEQQTDGNYYVFIQNIPTAGSLGNFTDLAPLYQNTIFCTGKSAEPSTKMVEGVDGNFYGLTTFTGGNYYNVISSNIIQLKLTTAPISPEYLDIYGKPPLQTSGIDLLTFNYDYVYAMGDYYEHYIGGPGSQSLFFLNPPTSYAQAFDLYILGGTPPYTITNIAYYGGSGNGTLSVNGYYFTPSIIASGYDNATISPPLGFTEFTTNTGAAAAVIPHFTGPVSLSNPNVKKTTNGYMIPSYITTDIYYPSNWQTVFPSGASCYPEWQYHWNYQDGPTGSVLEGASCAHYTGNSTNFTSDSFVITVKDSVGTTLQVPLGVTWKFQVVDFDYINNTFSFAVNQAATNRAPGNVITASGTYTYNFNLGLSSDPTSIAPILSPAQMKYYFSFIAPAPATSVGGFSYTPSGSLPTFNNLLSNPALVHVGCTASNPNPALVCNGFTGSPLIPNVSNQTINITQVYNNSTHSVVTLSNPIIVKFYPNSTPNTFTWNSLNYLTRTSNNSGTFSSPSVPYNMSIDVTFPTGELNFPGTLIIPFTSNAEDKGAYQFGNISPGLQAIEINFNNVV